MRRRAATITSAMPPMARINPVRISAVDDPPVCGSTPPAPPNAVVVVWAGTAGSGATAVVVGPAVVVGAAVVVDPAVVVGPAVVVVAAMVVVVVVVVVVDVVVVVVVSFGGYE